jgi:hydrogenase maturation protease
MHQTDLVDTLIQCDLLGHRPDAVVIGMEPTDYHTMCVEVSDATREKLPAMAAAVLEEICKAGGSCTPRQPG